MSAKDVWTLTDSWSDQTGWIEGRVVIKASELAGDTIFRVKNALNIYCLNPYELYGA